MAVAKATIKTNPLECASKVTRNASERLDA
jgi:hypothetical protein